MPPLAQAITISPLHWSERKLNTLKEPPLNYSSNSLQSLTTLTTNVIKKEKRDSLADIVHHAAQEMNFLFALDLGSKKCRAEIAV